MTFFVNLRGSSWGAVCSPYLLQGNPLADPADISVLPSDALGGLIRGKDLLLAAHGFNVSYHDGLVSLARLESALGLANSSINVFLGVLWPGDWVIPAVNYPAEDKIASQAGQLLGKFCDAWLTSARSLSFVSHSLGARVVLEAIRLQSNRIRLACLTAGAVNAGCLHEEYIGAGSKCDAIRTLSSREDRVLELAFPVGDFLGDILYPDHPQFEAALGRNGPTSPTGSNVGPSEIPDKLAYGHGDYFPPGNATAAQSPDAKWRNSAQFIASAYRGENPTWPNSVSN